MARALGWRRRRRHGQSKGALDPTRTAAHSVPRAESLCCPVWHWSCWPPGQLGRWRWVPRLGMGVGGGGRWERNSSKSLIQKTQGQSREPLPNVPCALPGGCPAHPRLRPCPAPGTRSGPPRGSLRGVGLLGPRQSRGEEGWRRS